MDNRSSAGCGRSAAGLCRRTGATSSLIVAECWVLGRLSRASSSWWVYHGAVEDRDRVSDEVHAVGSQFHTNDARAG